MTDEKLKLTDKELELVARTAKAQGVAYDPKKDDYTENELRQQFGIVRESYNREELEAKGMVAKGVVTSFDRIAERAMTELSISPPFARGIQKWQLPVETYDSPRIMTTVFPPDTVVTPHVHPKPTGPDIPDDFDGGSFRIVTRGSITFEGRKFGPGDWFYIPNGTPYTFTTDPLVETHEAYWYQYDVWVPKQRFSAPEEAV